jgi:hypothetical protein
MDGFLLQGGAEEASVLKYAGPGPADAISRSAKPSAASPAKPPSHAAAHSLRRLPPRRANPTGPRLYRRRHRQSSVVKHAMFDASTSGAATRLLHHVVEQALQTDPEDAGFVKMLARGDKPYL